MDKYDLLINELQKKFRCYNKKIKNSVREQENITKKISEIDSKKEDIEKEITEYKKILQEIEEIDTKINEQVYEHKVLKCLGIFIGCMFGGAAYGIASNYTASILIRLISSLITTVVSTTISIAADTKRKNDAIKKLLAYKEQYNIYEIRKKIYFLCSQNLELDEERKECNNLLESEKKLEKSYREDYCQIYKLLEMVYHAKNCLMRSKTEVTEEELNEEYKKDSQIQEVLSLYRKKTEKNGGGENGQI